jgi:hypothetical protein
MPSPLSYEFLFEDSLSWDDPDIDELLNDDETEHMILILAVKELQDRANLRKLRGYMAGRVCVLRNRALEHATLMQDYFVEVPTYPPIFFLEGTRCVVVCSLR